jgi:hypothetical protein
MSLNSPDAVRTDIGTLLDGVVSVPFFKYEPFTAYNEPFVTVFLDGYDAYNWNVTVRIYSPFGGVGAEQAQTRLDTLMREVEDALSSRYGTMSWTIIPDLEAGTLVAAWPIPVGREDF